MTLVAASVDYLFAIDYVLILSKQTQNGKQRAIAYSWFKSILKWQSLFILFYLFY